MIEDKTLSDTLVELKRTELALLALQAERRSEKQYCPRRDCINHLKKFEQVSQRRVCIECMTPLATSVSGPKLHAAAKRATLDLSRKLSELRASK